MWFAVGVVTVLSSVQLMDVSQRVWQTYARLDPVSLDRLITEVTHTHTHTNTHTQINRNQWTLSAIWSLYSNAHAEVVCVRSSGVSTPVRGKFRRSNAEAKQP